MVDTTQQQWIEQLETAVLAILAMRTDIDSPANGREATWYTGGSSHNDYRLRAEPCEAHDGCLRITDGGDIQHVTDLEEDPAEYAADWLSNTLPEPPTCRWAHCNHAVDQEGDACDAIHCERCGCPIEHGEPVTLVAEWVRDEVEAAGSAEGYPSITVCDVCTDEDERENWEQV